MRFFWENGHFLSPPPRADIQQPLMLISDNNNDGKRWQIAFLPLYSPPPPLLILVFLRMPLCRHSRPVASSLQFVVVLPLSP